VKPAIIASFCWRDQDESTVPEIVLLAWLLDFLSPDCQIVVMLSPPLRLAQSERRRAGGGPIENAVIWRDLVHFFSGVSVTGKHAVFGRIRAGSWAVPRNPLISEDPTHRKERDEWGTHGAARMPL
jgi:hypothetical protein